MNKLQWNFNQNTKLAIHEKASESIVCEMADILSGGDELMIHVGSWLCSWQLEKLERPRSEIPPAA